MDDYRISQLTERERDCLRLAARSLSSKEIAAQLGISHNTVDLHMRHAISKLGVTSRRVAARQLECWEAGSAEPIQRLNTQPLPLAEPAPIPALSPPIRTEQPPRFRVPFLRQGRQLNDLTAFQRLGWMLAIAVFLLIAVANFLNGLGVLQRITD